MIDTHENLILIDGQIRTYEIESCQEIDGTGKYAVVFKKSNKSYLFKNNRIKWLRKPLKLDPKDYRVTHHGHQCNNITTLLVFTTDFKRFYHIEYASGSMADYAENEIEMTMSCLSEPKSQRVFDYFKEIAGANDLKTDEGENILSRQYANIDFLETNLAVSPYLLPRKYKVKRQNSQHLIFPFGCNNSQIKAVQQAFSSQLSIIQGPPGTGKTQTILNIIANIIVRGKTVLVVSNNNSATENVLEKLKMQHLDFLVAPLGRSENKEVFVKSQTESGRLYPNELPTWRNKQASTQAFIDSIQQDVTAIQTLFFKQEQLAACRQELAAFIVEWEHFKKEVITSGEYITNTSATHLLKLLNELSEHQERTTNTLLSRIRKWIRVLIFRYIYRIDTRYLQDASDENIKQVQALFYVKKIEELKKAIAQLEEELAKNNISVQGRHLCKKSMDVLKNNLYQKYSQHTPYLVTTNSFYHEGNKLLNEFPVILSTTFSARNSLRNVVYDYVIMDEASQVSAETGVLALSCARNAVIVGDIKQLPNIVSNDNKAKLKDIFQKYDIDEGYDCSNRSFLQSVLDIIPSVSQTLLREHYRCAPEIIDFCNQKYYDGELVIMTKAETESHAISAIRTSKGQHCYQYVNQREIEVICKEVIPNLSFKKSEIGIIAPYNKQVDAIRKAVGKEIDVATVHKFQGREKDAIIMSIVDDQISSFTDDPNLLNVAVSRAKKHFCLVVTGNKQMINGNICDLLGYIDYHHGTITNSRIHSIYDMLYKECEKARAEYLQGHNRISEYDSENLTYTLISDILKKDPQWANLNVICHYPLYLLIRDFSPLTDEERRYARHHSTHVDFLIYNRVSKKPVLAIEVDGYTYHQQGTRQSERDEIKNRILPLYGINLLRLSTAGSGEKELIEEQLKKLHI